MIKNSCIISWIFTLATHESAALLQAGTSYERVAWLAKQLQFTGEQLAQENRDWEMIQKALVGTLT